MAPRRCYERAFADMLGGMVCSPTGPSCWSFDAGKAQRTKRTWSSLKNSRRRCGTPFATPSALPLLRSLTRLRLRPKHLRVGVGMLPNRSVDADTLRQGTGHLCVERPLSQAVPSALGRIHLLGGVKSGRSTRNSRGARCQCRLCTRDRTSGVTKIVLRESRLLISASSWD